MVTRRCSVQDSRVLRRRARRVLSAFVKLRREAGKPVEVFDASHVERMLRSGQANAAHHYLERFLLPVPVQNCRKLSYEIIAHVGVFKTLAKVIAGGKEGARIASLFANHGEYLRRSPASARLHEMIALMHRDRTRASMLWKELEPQGLEMIMALVAKCPELQGEVRLPRKRPLLWDAAPHGPRRCSSRCKQTTKRTPSDVLIRTFLRKRLLSVQGKSHLAHPRNASSQSAAAPMKMEQIAPQPTILEG